MATNRSRVDSVTAKRWAWRKPASLLSRLTRVRNALGKQVLTLVLLADERTDWRPSHYGEGLLGCRVRFDFPVCKLLDKVMPYVRSIERLAKEEGQAEG